MTTEHRTFTVHGRVQGVFFRQNTRQQAQQLHLTGYARNNPDGTVTIEAEGPAEALNALESLVPSRAARGAGRAGKSNSRAGRRLSKLRSAALIPAYIRRSSRTVTSRGSAA